MANIAVMTDSVSCIPQDLAKENQITIVPAANILVDGKSFIDGETISATEAYKLIKEDPDRFVTSAIQPDYLLHEYEKLAGKSKEILFISIASSLSAVSRTATLFMSHTPRSGRENLGTGVVSEKGAQRPAQDCESGRGRERGAPWRAQSIALR